MSLFREESISAQRARSLGDIILARPLSLTLLTTFFGTFLLGLIIFSCLFDYTKYVTVYGQLIPASGLVKVFTQQVGIVVDKKVHEGQAVKKGDVLFVLSSDHQSSTMGNTQEAISQNIKNQEANITLQLRNDHELEKSEHVSILDKISDLKRELETISALIIAQQTRLKLAQANVDRYQAILDKSFISQEEFDQKQADLLDQINRLKTLERDQITTQSELSNQLSTLQNLPLKYKSQNADLERSLTTEKESLNDSEGKRQTVVVAPIDGVVATVTVDMGQLVDSSRPLISLLPQKNEFIAELYVPSSAIGFIQSGDEVLLGYQAYPYQKFGYQDGVVESIAQTALPNTELTASIIPDAMKSNEPLYKIRVRLDKQTITTYGKEHKLQAGMLLEANIQQETRKIYEWSLEPLYSITGQV